MKKNRSILLVITVAIGIILALPSWINKSSSTFKIGEVTITGENNKVIQATKQSPSNNTDWDTITVADPSWTYMYKGHKKTVSPGLDSPKIHLTLDTPTNTYTVLSQVDLPENVDLPTITTFTKNNKDTLFVIISYKDSTNSPIVCKWITFDIKIEESQSSQVFYLLKDDPKTSRGTVTNIQSSTTIYEEEKLMKLH